MDVMGRVARERLHILARNTLCNTTKIHGSRSHVETLFRLSRAASELFCVRCSCLHLCPRTTNKKIKMQVPTGVKLAPSDRDVSYSALFSFLREAKKMVLCRPCYGQQEGRFFDASRVHGILFDEDMEGALKQRFLGRVC